MKMPDSVKIEVQAADALRALLAQVPAVERVDVAVGIGAAGAGPDLIAHAKAFGQQHTLLAEVTSNGQPRHVRSALLSLRNHVQSQTEPVTPVLIAPYLSPQAQDLCREFDVAFLDFEGNARLAFGGVFVSRQFAAKPVVARRELRSVFKPKSAQVLKLMLRDPSRAWRVAELAELAGVSLGHVSNVRNRLLDREWAQVVDGGLHLAAPDALLDAWREAYETPAGRRETFYTSLHGTLFDAAVRALSPEVGGHTALSSFSAAQWLAPFGRTGSHYFYADEAGLEQLRSTLKLESASKGDNLVVTVVEDDGLFRDTVQPAPGVICTSPVQTYLDLSAAGERGREAADHLRQERLRWPP